MTNKQMALRNGIIHSASLTAGAAGGGMAQVVGRTAAQVLCGWVPGIGNAVNAGTAFTITEQSAGFWPDSLTTSHVL